MAAPPPTYQEAIKLPWKLSYEDFMPQILEEGGIFSKPTYETFDALIKRANIWLSRHPNIKVIMCESLEHPIRLSGRVKPEKLTYTQRKSNNCYIRALRLYLAPKGPGDPPYPQKLGHINVVPACQEAGGFFSSPKYSSFSETISAFNRELRIRPLQGSVLNIETQEMKLHHGNSIADPDRAMWTEQQYTYFLYVIRIFYVVGPPAFEEIGCVDFVPGIIKEGGIFSLPEYDPFSALVERAHMWMQQNPGLRITNIQSVNYRTHKSKRFDSHESLYKPSAGGYAILLRVLRVCYVITMAPRASVMPPPPMLTYKTFAAQPLTQCCGSPSSFESLQEMMIRVQEWLHYNTGVRVLAVETVPLLLSGSSSFCDPENVMSVDMNRTSYWMFVLRLYLEGPWCDPPGQHPRRPPSTSGDCTIL